MAPKMVRYYFSFGSPFAALADAQIDALVEGVGAELDPIPINAPSSEPPKGIAATLLDYRRSYQYEDAARWAQGRDIDDRDVLGDCARDAGLSRDDFLQGLDEEHYRDALWARALAGLEERVFGVPLFIVDGQRFWGNDRLDFVLDALRGRP